MCRFFCEAIYANKTISDCISIRRHALYVLHFTIAKCFYLYSNSKRMRFLMKGFNVRNLHTQVITGSPPPSENDWPGQQKQPLVYYFENGGNSFICLKIKK